MSDPTVAAELENPPPQPPRPTAPRQTPRDFQGPEHYNPARTYDDPTQTQHQTSTPMSQMEADEFYARQLAEHYGATAPAPNRRAAGGTSRRGRGGFGNYPTDQPPR